jgi:hypothetical protein
MGNLGYIPASITAGESIWISAANTTQDTNADIVLTDYAPSGGYTLAYVFAATTPLTVSGVANGGNTGWTLDVAAAQTAAWSAGQLSFVGRVTHTSTARVFVVDSGIIAVTANPANASTYQAALSAVDAAIAEYASNPYGSFSLPGGITVTYRSLEDLLGLRDFYAAEVARTSANRQRRIIRSEFRVL